MAITQKEIAEKTGVSQALVATILNNRPGSRIRASEDTRRRVLEYALQHDYRPNLAARALQSGKTHTVACVYLRQADHNLRAATAYTNEILARTLGAHGYTLAVKVFDDQTTLIRSLLDICHARSADAVVLAGRHEDMLEQGRAIDGLGLPFVLTGCIEEGHPDWLQVDFDQAAMMQTCVRFLAERGCRKIAYIGFEFDAPFVLAQIAGYRAAMAQILGDEPRADYVGRWGESRDVAGVIDSWFALPPAERPEAYVVGSSNAWSPMERSLARRGLRMGYGPEEIATAGVAQVDAPLLLGRSHVFAVNDDGVPDGWYQIASAAAERLLIPLLNGETVLDPTYKIIPELVPTVPNADRFFAALLDEYVRKQASGPAPFA